MRGKVVCFMAPATFLTSLGLIDAAITRTRAVVASGAGSATSVISRTEGSPKALNRIARMICSFRWRFAWRQEWTLPRVPETGRRGCYASTERKHGGCVGGWSWRYRAFLYRCGG